MDRAIPRHAILHDSASRLDQPCAAATSDPGAVVIIDRDQTARDALTALVRSAGIEARSYALVSAMSPADLSSNVGCIIVDAGLWIGSGAEPQSRHLIVLSQRPIVVTSQEDDVSLAVRAMRCGAFNFLVKPYCPQDMVAAIREAIGAAARRQRELRAEARLRERAKALTPRELDVLVAVDRGLINKQIANQLGIALITVKMHRSNAFKKLGATSVTDMIQKVRDLNLGRSGERTC